MKKLFTLVLALILGFICTAPAVAADAATKTVETYSIDLPKDAKEAIWERGYKLRCKSYQNRRKTRRLRKLARVALLAPLSLVLGNVGSIIAPAKENDADVAEAKARNERWAWLNADAEYIRQCAAEQAELDREAKAKAKEAARELAKAVKKAADEQRAAEKKAEKERQKAEKLVLNKKIAWETSPVQAIELIRRIKAAETALDDLKDRVDESRKERDSMLKKAEAAKAEAETISAGLKKPTSSSRYRKAVIWQAEAEARLAELTNVFHSLTMTVDALESELSDIQYQNRMIKKYGNAFAKECAKAELKKFSRMEKEKKAETTDGIRPLQTIKERLKSDSFTLYSFDKDVVLKLYKPYSVRLNQKPDYSGISKIHGKDDEETKRLRIAARKKIKEAWKLEQRKTLAEFKKFLAARENEPLTVKESDGRLSRLRRSILSMIFGIDYDQKTPTTKWIVVEHGIQEEFNLPLDMFSDDKTQAQKMLDKFQQELYEHIGKRGIKVISRPDEFGFCNETVYDGLFSSASHQKAEKLVMADRDLMSIHEEALWFGKTKTQILNSALTGAQIWKMRANMARPIYQTLTTKDGTPVYLHDGKMVPDAVRKYVHRKALRIGGKNDGGKPYQFLNNADNEVVVGAGAILMLDEMNTSVAQLSGCGLKGCGVDARSSETYALKKHKTNRPSWLNGVKILFSEDCWKFDKAGYANYNEFAQHMDALAVKYPGINQVYVLRQGEEIEGEERVRTLTRSLLQQLLAITEGEIKQLTKGVVQKLNRMNTIGGLFEMAAELNKEEEERSPLGRLFLKVPGLLLEPAVQRIYEKKWTAVQHEGIGNKSRTKGQYPYITQDPVALYEIWALGMNPDRNDLGVLRDGEASINLLPKGYKVVGVRFPANALTAKTLVCKPCEKIFATCGNVCVLSIYDDILIMQDGDVDGDEMCILYDKLIVKLVERMRTIFQPPVIMFAHGDGAEKVVIGSENELIQRMYDSLWSAKRYDKVGLYANMARDCAYLAAIKVKALMRAKTPAERKAARGKISIALLWMAAASTGAILAIDQVKGNKVDQALIDWLDTIKRGLDQGMTLDERRCSPFTQPYVKGDFTIKALPANPDVGTDLFGLIVDELAPVYNPDTKGYVENRRAVENAMLIEAGYRTNVKKGLVTSGVLMELRYNYFNNMKVKDKDGNEKSVDAAIFEKIRRKEAVGLQDLLELFWRNQMSLQFRSAAKSVPEKKREYQEMVRQTVVEWIMSTEWVAGENAAAPAGHVFSKEEKRYNLLRNVLAMALQSVDPSFTKFCLEVFATDFEEAVNENGFDIKSVLDGAVVIESDNDIDCEETDFTEVQCDDEECDLSDILDGSMSLLGDEEDEW